ncbi:hypothetical protein [Paracidovorax avenae]|nr:hypothetical protein [Paracidovorax avenae]
MLWAIFSGTDGDHPGDVVDGGEVGHLEAHVVGHAHALQQFVHLAVARAFGSDDHTLRLEEIVQPDAAALVKRVALAKHPGAGR